MAKLNWYNYKGEEELPKHSMWSPVDNIIYIRSNDIIEPRVALSHEIEHQRLSHTASISPLGEELETWEYTILNLIKAGEWDWDAKSQAIWALSSYFDEEHTEDPEKEAKWWIDRFEKRARKSLGR